ncbi:MAG: MBL fold metallo-hydrolase [Treponema sp.]|nr:MBL fold metallo-hydrolase [Treponema sp.]
MAAIQILDSVYYIPGIPGGTNIGVVACSSEDGNSTDIHLIESGMHRQDAERIYKELERLFPAEKGGFKVKTVINTHAHTDHAGGNAFFKEKTSCDILISKKEAAILLNPALNGVIFCGGQLYPDINIPYFIAEYSEPTKIIDENTKISLSNGTELTFTSLPGHTFEMLGVKVKEKSGKSAFFAGDAFFGSNHIIKYWIPYLFDVKKFKETLDKLADMKCTIFVPSHGNPCKNIAEVTELNKIAVISTEQCIIHALEEKAQTETDILKYVADKNALNLRISQFVLISITIKAYLMYLLNEGRISFQISENRMVWSKTGRED